jgi:deoxycytidylate deaminase
MSISKHEEYFEKAYQVAKKSSHQEQKHGALIVNNKGEIISEGYNHMSCIYCHQSSIHAEVHAILNARKKIPKNKRKNILSKCKIYVVRIGKKCLHFKKSSPCINCYNFIKKNHIKTIIYSDTHDDNIEYPKDKYNYCDESIQLIPFKVPNHLINN